MRYDVRVEDLGRSDSRRRENPTKGRNDHSDADALIPRDACLGAAGLGDISRLSRFRSAVKILIIAVFLLRKVKSDSGEGLEGGGVDAIVAQAPKLAPYMLQMAQNLASDLGIAVDCVNIKANAPRKARFCRAGKRNSSRC